MMQRWCSGMLSLGNDYCRDTFLSCIFFLPCTRLPIRALITNWLVYIA